MPFTDSPVLAAAAVISFFFPFETLEAAHYMANNIACTGCGVTMFEYDQDDGCYTDLFAM